MKTRKVLAHALFALLLGMSTGQVQAGDLNAVINGKSFHIDSSRDWNERNYGFGLEYQFDTRSRWKPVVMANGFRDSQTNMSYMVGGGLHRNLISSESFGGLYLDVGINAFMMTRDNIDNGKPFPGALPSLTIGNRYIGTNITYLPRAAIKEVVSGAAMDHSMSGIVFMQFKVNVTEMLASR